jgi:hypothetical protein
MSLDLDGILKVTAIEKRTGKSKYIAITGATKPKTSEEIAAARSRLAGLYLQRGADMEEAFAPGDLVADDDFEAEEVVDGEVTAAESLEAGASGLTGTPGGATEPAASQPSQASQAAADAALATAGEARSLVSRSRVILDSIHDEDKEEIIDLHERIEQAIASRDAAALFAATTELKELLFFIEGK